MTINKSSEDLDVDVRFLLANERTLLAWVRTGLAIMAAGVAVAYLSTDSYFLVMLGVGAITLGGLLSLVGYSRYKAADSAIRSGKLPSSGKGHLIIVLVIACFAITVSFSRILTL